MEEYQKLWNDMLNLLREEIGEAPFENFFNNCERVLKFEKNYIYVVAPSTLNKFRIEKLFTQLINERMQTLTEKKIGVKFVVESDVVIEEKTAKIAEVDYSLIGRNLPSIYRFENFVTGESNRTAWLTAMNVASDGVKICNPLYIFGNVGLGKTHLMTSIGNYILDNNINAKVLYTSSQKFTEDYVMAVTYKQTLESIESFYNKYNSIDVLLVDDIQFLENKVGTQEEFFKVFENMINLNKQIVITSDRPPADLKNIMTRLRSRFGWGVSVEIKNPDEELLLNILKRKLSFLIDEPNDVEDDVLKCLASHFPDNIRDLEGALRTFVNYCICMNCPFSIENLHLALEKLIPKKENELEKSNDIFNFLCNIIVNYFKVSKEDIISSSRKQQIAYARQMLMYFLRNYYNIPLQTIGILTGNRDHATVSHGIDKITQLIVTNTATKSDCELITSIIKKTKK